MRTREELENMATRYFTKGEKFKDSDPEKRFFKEMEGDCRIGLSICDRFGLNTVPYGAIVAQQVKYSSFHELVWVADFEQYSPVKGAVIKWLNKNGNTEFYLYMDTGFDLLPEAMEHMGEVIRTEVEKGLWK